jgi:hypothetical protein
MRRLLVVALALALAGCPAPAPQPKPQATPSPSSSLAPEASPARTAATSPAASSEPSFAFVAPSQTPGVADMEELPIVVRVENRSGEELVLFPFFEVRFLDAQGKAVEVTRDMGRWGAPPDGCFLEAETFVTVPSGQSHEFRQTLGFFMTGGSVKGFKIQEPGQYRLEFRYAYGRASYRAKCRDACAGHDDPQRAWNRAYEGDVAFQGKLEVGP